MNDMVPSYISNLIPRTVGNNSEYNLRNSNNIAVQAARTSTFQRSCIPSSINLWNSLDLDIRQLPSISSFCYALKSQIPQDQVPQHYLNGNRKFSILHARIRNRCSNLNLDLYINHLKDDPICDCHGGAESPEHYFFECQRFTAQRINLFNQTRQFHPLNLETILCGRDNLSYENNSSIFLAVQKYIKDSARFE